MPGGVARLRVKGAMTKRLGKVSGPSLKGSRSFDAVIGISGLGKVTCRWAFLALRQCREPPAPRKGDEPRAGKMEKCRRICQGNAMFGLRDACPVEDPHPEKREARLE